MKAADVASELGRVAAGIAKCTKCGLHETRTRTVPGQGNPKPEILFVGEAPGADEDEQGLAFVGAAGQLLTKMIEAMGFTRDQVFIANILKCRPPDNRPPLPQEMVVCMPYLKEQIAILKPRVIVGLGATAVRGLLALETRISDLRGRWHSFEGIDFMPTFHPSYLLRNPSAKREAWDDLKAVLTRLGRAVPPARKPTA
jgi:DNA polymerase